MDEGGVEGGPGEVGKQKGLTSTMCGSVSSGYLQNCELRHPVSHAAESALAASPGLLPFFRQRSGRSLAAVLVPYVREEPGGKSADERP